MLRVHTTSPLVWWKLKRLMKAHLAIREPPPWKKMWHLKIPVKIRIFAWRACMNGLPTRLNLTKRGVNISPRCPIYDQELEFTTHSLIQCDLAKQVWDRWEGSLMNLRESRLDITDIALNKLLKT